MFRALVAAAFTIFVWGVTFVNTKALLVDFSALEIHVLRFGIAYLALTVVEWFSKNGGGRERPSWREEALFAGMGLSGVAVYQLLENCAVHYTNASNVSILVALNPVLTALFAWVLGQARRPGCWFLVGFLVAITGVSMVSLDGISEFHFRPAGDLMALGAMVSWSFYSGLVARSNERKYPQVWVMRRVFLWSLVIMTPFVLLGLTPVGATVMSGSFAVTLDPAVNAVRFGRVLNYVNLGFLGLFASAACFVLWNYACGRLGVVRCTIGLYLIPVVTVLFAFCFLGESLTLFSAAGAALTIFGVVISGWRRDTCSGQS